jgi:acetyl-CoA C-acetyltransferase
VKVWILGASRTPIGRFLGDFSNIPAPMLAGVSIRRTIERTRIDPSRIQELWIGNVLSAGLGQAPAKQAALRGGLGDDVSCTQVSKVCGSGLEAVVLAVRALQSGQASACIAAGMESMSQAPHLLVNSRMGTKYGSVAMLDSIDQDGLRCFQGNVAMGTYADQLASQQSISRSDQDAWALLSHQRAGAASDLGFFEHEIAPVLIDAKTTIRRDACPRQDTSLEKLAQLKPAFGPLGSVTAGNASGLADGAASLLVVDESVRQTLSSQCCFRVLACAHHSQSPAELFTAPVEAIRKVCRYADLAPEDIDLFEINEAFATQVIACVNQLGVSPERVNVHGGAIALGHPIGCSGTRILVTLMHAMERYGKRLGVASLCIGGGEAVAIAIEQEPIG